MIIIIKKNKVQLQIFWTYNDVTTNLQICLSIAICTSDHHLKRNIDIGYNKISQKMISIN